MNPDYQWWHDALNGIVGPIHENEPQCGFYRYKNDAIGIWKDGDQLLASRNDAMVDSFMIWTYAAKHPVSEEQFRHFERHGRWPDQIDDLMIGHNDAPDHELIADEIELRRKLFADYLEEIGGSIATQTHADKAASYAAAFAELEKRATEKHKVEKAPHLEAGRKVDDLWKPIIGDAGEAKKAVKKATEAYLIAEEAKRKAEAAKAPEVVIAAPVKAGGMSARTVALRTVERVEITDIKAAAAHIAALPNVPSEFVEIVEKIALRLMKAGAEVSGAKLIKERKAA